MVGSLLLPEASLSDVLMTKSMVETEDAIHIVVLREFTTEPLTPYLQFGLKEMGFSSSFSHSNYTLFPNDLESESLWQKKPDFLIFAPDTHLLYGNDPGQYFASKGEDFQSAQHEFLNNCSRILAFIRTKTDAPIFVLFPLPPYPFAHGLALPNDKNPLLSQHFDDLYRVLESELPQFGPVHIIRLQDAFQFSGINHCLDRRRRYASLTPFTPVGYRDISIEVLNRIRMVRGKNKKVIALDCDETIWAGISGEGEKNVGLDPGRYPDSAHLELQAYVQYLSRNGILVCLISKNEPETVWNIFDNHSGMILSRDDIVTTRINWQPKSENLKSIAEELNLGLDAFVFVDNTPAEIHEVKLSLPMVTTVLAAEEGLADLPGLLHRSGWFQRETVTNTDAERVSLYKSEQKRQEHRNVVVDHDDFLRSLEMQATVNTGGRIDIDRAAQMSQRTNQFNLTTKRYTPQDISDFADDEYSFIATIHLEDRFGSLGDVGLLMAHKDGCVLVIDTILLSCRAFGRYCENILLQAAKDRAKEWGSSSIQGQYKPTAKNGLVDNLWEKFGFSVEKDSAGNQKATIQLEKLSIPLPNVYKSIDTPT